MGVTVYLLISAAVSGLVSSGYQVLEEEPLKTPCPVFRSSCESSCDDRMCFDEQCFSTEWMQNVFTGMFFSENDLLSMHSQLQKAREPGLGVVDPSRNDDFDQCCPTSGGNCLGECRPEKVIANLLVWKPGKNKDWPFEFDTFYVDGYCSCKSGGVFNMKVTTESSSEEQLTLQSEEDMFT